MALKDISSENQNYITCTRNSFRRYPNLKGQNNLSDKFRSITCHKTRLTLTLPGVRSSRKLRKKKASRGSEISKCQNLDIIDLDLKPFISVPRPLFFQSTNLYPCCGYYLEWLVGTGERRTYPSGRRHHTEHKKSGATAGSPLNMSPYLAAII